MRSRQVRRRVVATTAAIALAAGLALAAEGKVNINTAGIEQLTLLPRIGEVVAQRILDYREENGNFKSPEELMLVQGIGEKTFELIEPYVSVSGETTLAEKVRISDSAQPDWS